MENMKSLPIKSLMLYIYPNLYPIHYQFDPHTNPLFPVQLTFANIERNGVYLLDTYDHLYFYICKSVHPQFLSEVFNVTQWSQIPDEGEQTSSSSSTSANVPPRNHINPVTSPPVPQMNGYHEQQSLGSNSLIHSDSVNSNLSGESTEDHSEATTSGDSAVKKFPYIPLPLLDNPTSQRIHTFINSLVNGRPFKPNFHILR